MAKTNKITNPVIEKIIDVFIKYSSIKSKIVKKIGITNPTFKKITNKEPLTFDLFKKIVENISDNKYTVVPIIIRNDIKYDCTKFNDVFIKDITNIIDKMSTSNDNKNTKSKKTISKNNKPIIDLSEMTHNIKVDPEEIVQKLHNTGEK